jgi:hypothetical protein
MVDNDTVLRTTARHTIDIPVTIIGPRIINPASIGAKSAIPVTEEITGELNAGSFIRQQIEQVAVAGTVGLVNDAAVSGRVTTGQL